MIAFLLRLVDLRWIHEPAMSTDLPQPPEIEEVSFPSHLGLTSRIADVRQNNYPRP